MERAWSNLQFHGVPEENGVNFVIIFVVVRYFINCFLDQRFTYSLSNKKEVFSFQKPGPLGFVLFVRCSVIREWSVLKPGASQFSFIPWNFHVFSTWVPLTPTHFLFFKLICFSWIMKYDLPFTPDFTNEKLWMQKFALKISIFPGDYIILIQLSVSIVFNGAAHISEL